MTLVFHLIFLVTSCMIVTVHSLNIHRHTPTVVSITPAQAQSHSPFIQKTTCIPTTLISTFNRRESLSFPSTFAVLPIVLLSPTEARADKLISNQLASPSALRYVKLSIKVLSDLEFYASTNDYEQIKLGLRGPGLDQLRKNASILVGSNEEGPVKESLASRYSTFIHDLEKLDSEASLGIRGRKNISMSESYEKCLSSLNDFVDYYTLNNSLR